MLTTWHGQPPQRLHLPSPSTATCSRAQSIAPHGPRLRTHRTPTAPCLLPGCPWSTWRALSGCTAPHARCAQGAAEQSRRHGTLQHNAHSGAHSQLHGCALRPWVDSNVKAWRSHQVQNALKRALRWCNARREQDWQLGSPREDSQCNCLVATRCQRLHCLDRQYRTKYCYGQKAGAVPISALNL